jgi:hypothetical protein
MLDVPCVRLRLRDTATPWISKFFQSPSQDVFRLFKSPSSLMTTTKAGSLQNRPLLFTLLALPDYF